MPIKSHEPGEPAAAGEYEIEITPEMVEADDFKHLGITKEMLLYGKLELYRDRTMTGDELLVARVYRAMELARRNRGSP